MKAVTEADRDIVSTLPELFDAQARSTPEAVAVRCGGESISYRELQERSNRLARLLIRHGVGPECTVGLALTRSTNLVVALVSILKTGAAYLPIDPGYPDDRIAFMLRDAEPVCIVCDTALSDRIPGDRPRILLDEPRTLSTLGEFPVTIVGDRDRTRPLSADNVAYVIYTSGSTGQPKGTLISHRNVVRLFDATGDLFHFDGTDVWTLFHSYAFDFSVWEIWGALLHGGRLVVVPQDITRSPTDLLALLAREGVTVLNQTPSTFYELITAETVAATDTLAALRLVVLGGEALDLNRVGQWYQRHPDTPSVVNMYGITETTVHVTHKELDVATAEGETGSLIGTAVPGLRLHVLGPDLGATPVGTTGELYVAGEGLARGYLNNAALTAQRFVADPFGPAGSRMYRSGDLVRRRADGELEYVGRADDQVKIRGFRVEPGEVEATLARHPQVRRAAVAVHEAEHGEKQLIGYVVPADRGRRTPTGLDRVLVEEWREVYDRLYRPARSTVLGADFVGWTASHDGTRIPIDQMRDWQEATAERIREIRPRRVLEIGVGTGLLLSELAAECQAYWGIDISEEVINKLSHQVDQEPKLRGRVKLRACPADELDWPPTDFFDTVILNSVAQYFPSADYLVRVLAHALRLVVPGGAVFVGDLRNLRLLRHFHTETQLRRCARSTDAAVVRMLVERAVAHDTELLVDPDFFAALPTRLPEVGEVDVRVKDGRHDNELTRYRYDVVLRRRSAAGSARVGAPAQQVRWAAELPDEGVLFDHLSRRPDRLTVVGVPNRRLTTVVDAMARLATDERVDLAKECLADVDPIEPLESLRDIGKRLGYRVDATWSRDADRLDVIFTAGAVADDPGRASCPPRPLGSRVADLERFTNSPVQARSSAQLLASVRDHLRDQLPDHMVPAAVLVLDELPLTTNGKTDRHALPRPVHPSLPGGRRARTPLERVLCELFREVLDLPDVTIDDNFFDLGGHSLSAMRLANRVRSVLGVHMTATTVFQAPTIADLAARCDGRPTNRARLTVGPRPPVLPLSFGQRRLWFLHRFEGPSATDNIPLLMRLRGPLHVRKLRAALADVVGRHESLRTLVGETDGDPRQIVVDAAAARPELVVVEPLPGTLTQVLRDHAGRPFDLGSELPIRAVLVVCGNDEHRLLLIVHHIAIDGWSLAPLSRDLAAAYRARLRDDAPAWAPLPLQYGDYACWQRRAAESDNDTDSPDGGGYRDQLAYWTRALAELPERLPLPTDRPRPHRPSYRGRTLRFDLPPRLHRGLAELANHSGASMFMVLHAGLAALLTRMGAGTDLPIGTPVAGRADECLNNLVGFFVNTLVLRTDTSGDPTFRELLNRIRAVDLAAYANQDVPFDRLVELLKPRRSLSHHPLFQVMFALQNTPDADFEFAGLDTTEEPIDTGTCRFELVISMTERHDDDGNANGIAGVAQFSTDIFDDATIAELSARFRRLLDAVVEQPGRRVAAIELHPADERLVVPYQEIRPDRAARPWPLLFEAQVDRTPKAAALVHGEVELSYRELNGRANRLARHIVAQGVGPDDIVAIALPRSVDLIVAITAVLKAGAAYLPVDPAYPVARIATMVNDARPVLLLTDRATRDRLPGSAAVPVVLDQPDTVRRLAAHAAADLTDAERTAPLSSRNTAYLIYTSGSTGAPKGTLITHTGLTDLVAAQVDRFGVRPGSRILQFASPSFDSMVWELCGALLTGATLVVPATDRLLPGPELADLVAHHQVTHATLPPSALATMMPADLRSLSSVIVAGERPSVELVRRWSPATRLINGYGLTETTVCVSLSPPLSTDGDTSMGAPIRGARVHVLDSRLSPVPPGVPGELYVAGPGLARGYLRRPAATAERFVANPFGPPGDRMYRTGDIARWHRNGELEFVRRADSQVKIRGFRVEPGEVERVLDGFPQVAACIVMSREDSPEDTRLVAYVLPTPGSTVDCSALRQHASALLPHYLVPSAIVPLDSVPLTPNGKVDRAALPAPVVQPLPAGRAPGNPVEVRLCELFASALKLPRVTVDDGFFDLGGHSLLANRLIARVRAAFGVDLPVRVLFERQTVAQLAPIIAATPRTQAPSDPPRVDVVRDPVLDPAIRPGPGELADLDRNADPDHVLLTGGTGFVGCFLLRELLDRTGATVHCLVRADDEREALGRLRGGLARYQLWDPSLERRIVPVLGDLSAPLLGLDTGAFGVLSEQLDAIYHAGARVSAVESHDRLVPANALGTQEVLRLAARPRPVPVHYVSTAAVVIGAGADGEPLREEQRARREAVLPNGYVTSKWLAEEFVWAAMDRGVPVTVYRPSRVTGHSRTGASGTDDSVWHLLKAMLILGAAPVLDGDRAAVLDFVPVDYLVGAIVRLSRDRDSMNRAFHLTCPSPVDLDTILDCLRDAGYPLTAVGHDDWRATLLAHVESRDLDDDCSLDAAAVLSETLPELIELAYLKFDQTNTFRGLAGSDLAFPALDRALVRRYVDHFVESGFFPPARRADGQKGCSA